jgi:DNA-binding transcriptional LysR family regulator
MDMTGHNLALLASLSVLLDEANVTRAAARLGISQPALSAQLARLRDIFGDPLLSPALSGKGMVLTPRAAILRDPLRVALQQVGDVVSNQPVFDATASARTFSVGANDNASAIVGARLVGHVRAESHSGMRLAIRSIDFSTLADQLENGDIDVALLSRNALPSHMPRLKLMDEEFRMAQRKNHPRGGLPPAIEEYAQLEHAIVSGDGGGFSGFVDDLLKARSFTRRVTVSVQYYSLVPLILAATDLVSTLPASFLRKHSKTLTSVPLPFDAGRFSLFAAWHPRFDKDPAHLWLRERLVMCTAV